MCGRYRLVRKKEILAEVFDAGTDVDWAPRYNVAPTQDVPVIRQDATQPTRSLSLMRWGLIPFWAKDPKVGFKMINARAETIAERPAFREPLQSRRCLIPADGFYEWAKERREKVPCCFTLADDSTFAFAGIWDRWKNPGFKKVEPLVELLRQYRTDSTRSWRVSSRVNSVQNDDAACIQEFLPAQSSIQDSLFPNSE